MPNVILFALCLLLPSCGGIRVTPVEQQRPPASAVIDRPAACLQGTPYQIRKISEQVASRLAAYRAGQLADVTIQVELAQCFGGREAFLDVFADPRITPRPGSEAVYRSEVWRQANYDAWAAAVTQLRAPRYAQLTQTIESAGGRVLDTRLLGQIVLAELRLSQLITLLSQRDDILMVYLPGEIAPAPGL